MKGRVERCLCGDLLSFPRDMESWTPLMARHVRTARHRRWRETGWLDAYERRLAA